MDEVKVTITTTAPISVKVIQTKPDSGYLKLTERLKTSEDQADAVSKRKND